MKITRIYLCIGILVVCLISASCSSYEKIGSYRYKTKMVQVFTGDYGGEVQFIKSYYLKNKFQAGVIIKSQLGFEEHENNKLFMKGKGEIDNIKKQLISTTYYFYQDSLMPKKDSTLKIFQQLPNGKLKLKLYRVYSNGVAIDKEF